MTDFNQAIILGNLTRDPEFKQIPSGQSVANFSIATNRRWTTPDGNQQENTQFHNVVAWGKLAEICNKILYKGRKVLVVGRIQTRNWEGQDGIKRYTTEIIADQVSATGISRTAGEGALTGSAQSKDKKIEDKTTNNQKNDSQESKNENKKDEEIDLDDIPF